MVQEEQNTKASKVKDLVLEVEGFGKYNLELGKEIQTKDAAGSVTGVNLMMRDFQSVQKHKVGIWKLINSFLFIRDFSKNLSLQR